MKNREFFYNQYERLTWENQLETEQNKKANEWIIDEVLLKEDKSDLSIFDIGFGVGFFLKMCKDKLPAKFEKVKLSGVEPSVKNYEESKKVLSGNSKITIETHNKTLLNAKINERFDVITSIYSFPEIIPEDLEETAKKINQILETGGKFVLVIANEKYLNKKLKEEKDLFIEKGKIELGGKEYEEILHYADIPKLGTVIDFNREEEYYEDLFKKYGFDLKKKHELDDHGFVSSIFVFEKVEDA